MEQCGDDVFQGCSSSGRNVRFRIMKQGQELWRKRRRRSLSVCANARDMHRAKRRWNEALRSSASPISCLCLGEKAIRTHPFPDSPGDAILSDLKTPLLSSAHHWASSIKLLNLLGPSQRLFRQSFGRTTDYAIAQLPCPLRLRSPRRRNCQISLRLRVLLCISPP